MLLKKQKVITYIHAHCQSIMPNLAMVCLCGSMLSYCSGLAYMSLLYSKVVLSIMAEVVRDSVSS